MNIKMHIEKAKLPKRMSYPLKSSTLQTALDQAQITEDVHLLFGPNHVFFEAFFWPPNENIDYERFYIRTGAVSSIDSGAAREIMEGQVIPQFIAWAEKILALPHNSPNRLKKRHFYKHYPA